MYIQQSRHSFKNGSFLTVSYYLGSGNGTNYPIYLQSQIWQPRCSSWILSNNSTWWRILERWKIPFSCCHQWGLQHFCNLVINVHDWHGLIQMCFSIPHFQPPTVKCLTKLWHPNISEEGEICLSLLRQNSIDGLGWAPTRKLKDVIWGLNSLFTVSWNKTNLILLT